MNRKFCLCIFRLQYAVEHTITTTIKDQQYDWEKIDCKSIYFQKTQVTEPCSRVSRMRKFRFYLPSDTLYTNLQILNLNLRTENDNSQYYLKMAAMSISTIAEILYQYFKTLLNIYNEQKFRGLQSFLFFKCFHLIS